MAAAVAVIVWLEADKHLKFNQLVGPTSRLVAATRDSRAETQTIPD